LLSCSFVFQKAGKVANFVIDNVFGLHSGQAKKYVLLTDIGLANFDPPKLTNPTLLCRKLADVPDGHAVCHTGKGQQYLQKLGYAFEDSGLCHPFPVRFAPLTTWITN
jgi:hypothetical protein